MLKQNDILTVEILDVNNLGNGIAKVENFVIFVPFVLVGEKVKIEIVSLSKNFAIGYPLEILSKHIARIESKCPFFMECGGCDFQHCTQDLEKEIKNNYLKNIFKTENLKPIITLNEFNYRNKISLFVKDFKLGLYKRGTNQVVEISDCMICEKWCKSVISITNNFLTKSQDKDLLGFVFRVVKDSLLVTILSKRDLKKVNNKHILDYYAELENLPFLSVGLSFCIVDKKVMLNYDIKHLIGNESLIDEFCGIKYPINNGSFMQVNSLVKNELYQFHQNTFPF